MRLSTIALSIVVAACSTGVSGDEGVAQACEGLEAYLADVQQMFSGAPPEGPQEAAANRERVNRGLEQLQVLMEASGDSDLVAEASIAATAADNAFGAPTPTAATDQFQEMFDALERLGQRCAELGVTVNAVSLDT